MVILKINNNHPQNSNVENEVEPEENCKQIAYLISQPNFKETFLNTIDKILFQKWYTKVRIVIDKEYIFNSSWRKQISLNAYVFLFLIFREY